MKYRHIHILAALFLIVGMAMQFVMAYRQVMRHQQENMDLKMQIAHEKMLFELYDAYEVVDQMEDYVLENLAQPDEILKCTRDVQEHYPSCFCLHVDFPENYFPKKGRWYSLFSYRQNDSIRSEVKSGDAFDYSQREWYQGALKSGSKGYWGKPYWSDIVEKMLFTYSDNLVDKDGQQVCVVGMDFSVAWLQQLMEQFRPMEEAICVIYSSDGTVLTANHDVAERVEALNLDDGHWIVSRQKLNTIDIEMAIAVPKSHIWQGLLWRMSVPFVIFVLGILVVGALIRRMMRDQQENARLESDRKVMSHELQIANGIQMGMERWMDMVAHDADLLEAVKRYIGTAEPTDDITLMTISRKSGVRAQTND